MEEIMQKISDIKFLEGTINAEQKAQVVYELSDVLKSYAHGLYLHSMVPGFHLEDHQKTQPQS